MESHFRAGFGLAGWALSQMLMASLRSRGLLSQEEGAVVIDQALALLEEIDAVEPDEALHFARRQMEEWSKRWHAPRAAASGSSG